MWFAAPNPNPARAESDDVLRRCHDDTFQSVDRDVMIQKSGLLAVGEATAVFGGVSIRQRNRRTARRAAAAS